jgi:hypothetical protein
MYHVFWKPTIPKTALPSEKQYIMRFISHFVRQNHQQFPADDKAGLFPKPIATTQNKPYLILWLCCMLENNPALQLFI